MRPLLLSLLLLLAACGNPRRDEANSREPASRAEATALLRSTLSERGIHLRNLRAEADALGFDEFYAENASLGEPGMQWISRSLFYAEISKISRPACHDEGWALEVFTPAGQVRLVLDDRQAALQVRAALLRLRRPD